MGKNQVEIFATSADFACTLRAVEEQVGMLFATIGMFESETIRTFDSSTDVIEAMGQSGACSLAFLAVSKESQFVVRAVPQKRGNARYCVDQLSNPRSVVLRPGGLVEKNTILAGQIGTASPDPGSLALFSVFGQAVRKHFSKVKSFWVGPQAMRLLDSGGRLTSSMKAPSEFDLAR